MWNRSREGVFGDPGEVKVSVMEGHSVTLHTDLTELQTAHDEIDWRFGVDGPRIARMINSNPRCDYHETFRDRLEINTQTGDLTIKNIRSDDRGVYQLIIGIGNKKRFKVTVNAPSAVNISESTQTSTSSSSSSSSKSSGVSVNHMLTFTTSYKLQTPNTTNYNKPGGLSDYIIPLSCAAAAGFLMVVSALLIFCICRKHRKTQQQDHTGEEQITYADPTFYRHDTKAKRVKEEDEVLYAGVVTRH
ncbi:uncharacterized protein LOC130549047 [Triplophysa rosa]|uniref:uncharacterized protein LOC130549047 n=1 Tax=Triplophysa rosa TaxID=992332 RepID=UPI0025463381|nr:uncharacterized protein LOC130549047 [Triplophysa rosa]